MFSIHSLEDLSLLRETVELECKLAQGQSGQGEVPKDFWPTYSAMANAHGGVVLLGVREKDGVFSIAGIANPAKVRADLFNNLNNPGKVSANLLADADVQEMALQGQTILLVRIPQATRKQRPVFLNGQPLGHTYKRLNDGDRLCDEETVKRMLAEQVEDERDARILSHFGMEDIDTESLRIYRQMLKDEKPGHPYLEQDDFAFLQSLRGWRRDRATGVEGLTFAGLLMFGRWSAIQEAVPHYFVDYQERPEAKTELRWVDRLVPDGTWSGNLFEFYRRVYRKLVADLKVPFGLKGGQRQDDTPVHVALREALVNTLVHADYTGRVSVLVVKRPDMFGFRNPGGLRLPLEQVIRGGESDCRNRILHQMFLLIGLGERGGSGMPKIFSGWQSRHWRQPLLREKDVPEQTLLELHMLDLLPGPVLDTLKARFGAAFERVNSLGRVILATAMIEGVVNHARMTEICTDHPHDLSQALARLERDGMLLSQGQSRGKVYHLPGSAPVSPEQVFAAGGSSGNNDHSSGSSAASSGSNEDSSGNSAGRLPGASSRVLNEGTEQAPRDGHGCLLSPLLDAPVVDALEALSPALRDDLLQRAALPRAKARLDRDSMAAVILSVCEGRYVRLSVLAELLNRDADGLRKGHLDTLVKDHRIRRAFPGTPTHEMQSYRTADSTDHGADGS
ncbi:RNA-binding domain-containing protein [Acidovorax sp. SUPP3334]|uniref:RNA-binding domain-containing protein n=1 Tax=Acidovorax sp. SUPP3334 TaxID=2920881 RepID=UPI0023DE39FD|nr:RNA-binding domain-containing protein [Acidovorax sp. SUPP3334]GKT23584.1 putative DNA binding domain-containing protein [Acidovorax sp. SUPP3334]